jgi:FkbM family methyltransferase|tara:strand:- start:1894 stop:2508 length:615 start_codon:yes stop_codon:yes gene_type:complete
MNILQIGCNEGNDKVTEFLNKNKKHLHKVLLVDASSSALELAKTFYKDFEGIDFRHVAVIDSDESEIDLFYPVNTPNNVHCSVLEQHVTQHKEIEGDIYQRPAEKVKKEKVPATKISNLLDYFYHQYIDRLYIDVEGLDCKIIDDIDFEKYNIGYIRFEHTHSENTFKSNGPNLETTIRRLNKFGYTILADPNCHEDLIALKNI